MSKFNAFGIPLISDRLWKQLFSGRRASPGYLDTQSALSKFAQFGLDPASVSIKSEGLEPELPPLVGGTLDSHFEFLGKRFDRYRQMAIDFSRVQMPKPPTMSDVRLLAGWQRYVDGSYQSAVAYPIEPVSVLDTETMVLLGNTVVMAVAASDAAWYIWLHLSLVDESVDFDNVLLPVQSGSIYIAHNALFDASKTDKAYSDKAFETVWLDTLSMHQAVSGISSKMRALYKMIEAGKAEFTPEWFNEGSTADLISCYNLHVRPDVEATKEEKTIRDLFVKSETVQQIRDRLMDLIAYNIADVSKTFELFQALLPKYLQDNPSPVTFAGAVIMSDTTLPVADNWREWKENTEALYQSEVSKISGLLLELAESIYSEFEPHLAEWQESEGSVLPEFVTSDPWLTQLNWSLDSIGRGKKKTLFPAWYRKIYDVKRGRGKLSTATRITPLLLRLAWLDKPLVFVDGYGWMYSVDSAEDAMYSSEGGKHYRRVPHKDGDNANCGDPLAKDYVDSLEKGVLSSKLEGNAAKELIRAAIATSYWRSIRERISNQLVHNGKIKPQLLVHGTVTRRAVENLWLTVSGAKRNKIGSEAKSRVQAPKGKVFVHSDFDAQELTIAGAFADAQAIKRNSTHGATPMSFINLTGSKAAKTDGHSLLATDLTNYLSQTLRLDSVITRSVAKTINFALLYMAGVATLASYIKKSAKELTEAQAKAIAKEAITRRRGKTSKDSFGKKYVGGTDSDAYNFMASIADSADPKTPLLRSRIASSLRPFAVKGDYLTSRMNWTIQSSGVDLLHCFLSAVDYLIVEWQISGARFLFSFHDEILYEVDEQHARLLAKAFQVAHIWTWSYFYQSIGLRDIPDHRAFFSAVELDTVFRKEASGEDKESIVTVSNPVDAPDGVVLTAKELFDS